MIEWPNSGPATNRRPAGQSGGSDDLSATLAADRAFSAAVALAISLFVLSGCRHEEQVALPFPLAADGKPAIIVQLEPTFIHVTSRKTGVRIIPGVEIYSGGGFVLRDFDGSELEGRIPLQHLAALLRFFDAERIFGLTDRAVEDAVAPDTRGAGRFLTHQNYTRLIIRQPNVMTHVSRYDLPGQIKTHPNCRELQAIQRCVDKVYETVGAAN